MWVRGFSPRFSKSRGVNQQLRATSFPSWEKPQSPKALLLPNDNAWPEALPELNLEEFECGWIDALGLMHQDGIHDFDCHP